MSTSPVVPSTDADENEIENNRNLYDKAGKTKPTPGRRPPAVPNPDGDEDTGLVSSNIKTVVVICSKFNNFVRFL